VRVFHVSDCYAPRVGGVESQIRDLAHAQVAAGHEVHVLTVEPDPAAGESKSVLEDDGLMVHRMGAHLPFNAPFNPAAARRTHRIVRELVPDVIHVHAGTFSPFSYGVARVALAEGVPLATTWHSMLDHAWPVLRPWTLATGWPKTPIAWSAVSRVAADQVARVFGAEVGILHNGIDVAAWQPDGAETTTTASPLRCVATMRLVPSKRTLDLIEIFVEALSDLPQGAMTLDLFGNGPERWRIERRIARRDLGSVVTLHGRALRQELANIYRSAHLFCSPATREAFGIAVLEARTAGLVVLGRRGTGISEFIDSGRDGLLVDTDREFARELTRMATDNDAFQALRGEARSSTPPFGIDRVVAASFEEYERARALRMGHAFSSH
jgi:glycosyltransferase involved in cell wall biosynthesis